MLPQGWGIGAQFTAVKQAKFHDFIPFDGFIKAVDYLGLRQFHGTGTRDFPTAHYHNLHIFAQILVC